MICKYCQKEISHKGLKKHLRIIHNLTAGKEYYDLYLGEELQEEIITEYVTKELNSDELARKFNYPKDFLDPFLIFKGVKRSNSESKKTNTYKEKYNKSIKKKYGVDNISQSAEIKTKKEKSFLNHFGYKNNFANENIRNKTPINYAIVKQNSKKTFQEKYGVDNPSQIPHVKEKLSEKQKITAEKSFKNNIINGFWKNCKFISSLEKRIQRLLKEENIDFQNNIWKFGSPIDLYFEKSNLVIEINGDFWHANPEKYQSNDKIYTNKKGIIVYACDIWKKDKIKQEKILKHANLEIIWEKEIKTLDDQSLKIKLKELIKKYENQINQEN